ncbi:MAG: primosomal protein N', partial [Clostridia bacterium]|nr:primosomal protein N' [Clostridia bacterium]
VTGSGKTEIYIKIIKELIQKGKSAILLVPEIALTPQTVRRFYSYFGDEVAIIHSGLTPAQRYDEYKRMKNGDAHIAIGTRTAVFAPLKNIGVIIIDEEQEYTYKSENAPRYSADEVAKYRAVKHNCLVVLGSATPSVSTRYSAETGKLTLVRLDKRFNSVPLPITVISDMRGKIVEGEPSCIGNELAKEIRTNLENREKTILFLNRRGASNRVVCVDCGNTPVCKNCNVSLVFHSKSQRLLCHHCGYSVPAFSICPDCGSVHLKYEGVGTQKVEEELNSLFPEAKVIRMDADTVTGRTTHEKLLDEFGAGVADILLGTQMVAKGLDFENVTLVGVIDCDGFLTSGDYRAQERAFSLITQVIGRAGRRCKQGRAVIQTYSPNNPVIVCAANQDYDSFYESEIKTRQALNVPPFCDIFTFTVSGESEDYALRAALSLSAAVVKGFKNMNIDKSVLGPIPSVLSKLNGKYRFNVSFRGKNDASTRAFIASVLSSFSSTSFSRRCTVTADVNNYS